MNTNEARYIVRMITAFKSGILFLDSTDEDASEIDRMTARYDEAGGFNEGREVALAEFVLRVADGGVLGGELISKSANLDDYLKSSGVPRIERPRKLGDGGDAQCKTQ